MSYNPESVNDPAAYLQTLISVALIRPDAHDQTMIGPGTDGMEARMLTLPLDGQDIIVGSSVGYTTKDGQTVWHVRTPGAVGTEALLHDETGFMDIQLFSGGDVSVVNVPTKDGENTRSITDPDEKAMCIALATNTLERTIEANPVTPLEAKKYSWLGRLLSRRL